MSIEDDFAKWYCKRNCITTNSGLKDDLDFRPKHGTPHSVRYYEQQDAYLAAAIPRDAEISGLKAELEAVKCQK